jgi:hypothetical protein
MTGGGSIPHATMSSQVSGETSSSAAPLSRLDERGQPASQLEVCLARGHAARHHMRMRSPRTVANSLPMVGLRDAGRGLALRGCGTEKSEAQLRVSPNHPGRARNGPQPPKPLKCPTFRTPPGISN